MIPRETEVNYDHANHRYFLNNQRYLSATQLVSLFKNEFDKEERSQYMEERYGSTAEEWKGKWDEETEKSIVRGNEIHRKKEERTLRKSVLEYGNRQMDVINILKYPKNIKYDQLPDGIYPELKLWRHDCRIAGRGDKIILRKDINDNAWYAFMNLLHKSSHLPDNLMKMIRVADIEDYKTNKAITDYSPVNAKMLGPLSHITDCKKSHITLQFSIYQYMLEYHGFIPGTRKIIHYPHAIPELGIPEPRVIELPYWREEVISMVDWLRKLDKYAI